MSRRKNMLKRTRAYSGFDIAAFVAVFVAWELMAVVMEQVSPGANTSKVFPRLELIFSTGFDGLGRYCIGSFPGLDSTAKGLVALFQNSGITMARTMVGYAIATGLGIACALPLSRVRIVRKIVSAPVNIARVAPAFAMAPLFILWFGATTTATVIFIVFSVFFMVLVAELEAIDAVDAEVVEYAQTLGLGKLKTMVRILLPASLGSMGGTITFAGLVAWTSVLSAELNGLTEGLGFIVADNLKYSNIPEMFLGALFFCICSFATMKALGRLMDHLLRWR